MNTQTLSSLLQPFLATPLGEEQLAQISAYLELLLKWNSKMNLTSVRQPEEMVTRHFGESLFAAGVLSRTIESRSSLLDLGSGAGFPGLPIKIALSQLDVMLAESQIKKATFLREVIRSLGLTRIQVHAGRAESLKQQFDVVAMRAVDGQTELLQTAWRLLSPNGLLLLMVGSSAIDNSKISIPNLSWFDPVKIPESVERYILIGIKAEPLV